MVCPKCDNEVSERAAFCSECGASRPKKNSTPKKVFKWGGIGCGGLLVLFLALVIIAALATEAPSQDEDETSSPRLQSDNRPMTATVKILPGAIEVINEDTFPWHGLIITVHDRYSTKYHFGDFNWGFLSEDSILQPQEETGAPIDGGFIDENGKEFEGKLYTIIAGKVELEARTRADGPYDLKATFNFTTDDPIINHGIIRTNKPVDSGSGVHATPYALAEELERLPTFKIRDVGNALLSWWIEAHEPKYHEILEAVSGYPQDAFGVFELPSEDYAELESKFAPERKAERDSRRARWDEREEHWANIDAFKASMAAINADHIIDQEESQHICFALDQWTAQMNAAIDYIQEYRRDEPEFAAGVGDIEGEAAKILELLDEADCQ